MLKRYMWFIVLYLGCMIRIWIYIFILFLKLFLKLLINYIGCIFFINGWIKLGVVFLKLERLVAVFLLFWYFVWSTVNNWNVSLEKYWIDINYVNFEGEDDFSFSWNF